MPRKENIVKKRFTEIVLQGWYYRYIKHVEKLFEMTKINLI